MWCIREDLQWIYKDIWMCTELNLLSQWPRSMKLNLPANKRRVCTLPVQPLIVSKKKKKSQSCGLFWCGTRVWSHIIAASVARMYLIANMDLVWTHLFMSLHHSCFLVRWRMQCHEAYSRLSAESSSVLHCSFFFLTCQIRRHRPLKAKEGKCVMQWGGFSYRLKKR